MSAKIYVNWAVNLSGWPKIYDKYIYLLRVLRKYKYRYTCDRGLKKTQHLMWIFHHPFIHTYTYLKTQVTHV